MVVANGYIRVHSVSGGGFDDYGRPTAEAVTLGDPVICNFQRNSYNKRGTYDNGVFTVATYVILIDEQEFEPCEFTLYDMYGTSLGEFEVHQNGILHLQAVGNIQITV